MSTRGTRGRGHGRGRGGARAGSSSSGHQPNEEVREAPVSPMDETGSQDQAAGDDALSQAMLRILERLVRLGSGNMGRGSVTKRLRSNGAEIFRGIDGVTLNVAEYWIDATERIMDDLDCTLDQKLKGTVSLLRDKAYQWWLTINDGTQADRLTWEVFKTTFQAKYVGASYVDACRREFLNLTQRVKTVAEYEAEFLRLSRFAREMVATEYEQCVRFEDSLRDGLKVLIAPQRE
ncbi:uncharacterized protein LOC108465358 [Gossypium arboreum]|uniref:uncharacterized protein LOC108465358 n=1 Tax=Gossypium arboreum TaxID=29729 RepID=UPI0008192DC1|nr:uncharacterized protein LOC108465358 [Gossypium arboreum]